ncbi:ATP synthase F1 subunit epsilon [Candidatus Jorgensenbacteria bacterium RIFCSPLOWO2_01_FULL_45_25b]|uniref:ATP synthase epsilon chain n=1 Tax=Candidatus Jorgensenbacteria bacterium RIFCSPLOWO2_01_FULL_45_25b TaxID=1798471 RepID=A0A1F6BYV0_9BACT|nr:MAG: ATP synthase F1 subunit epsilon [Candidatus Jorgensenbacteria bacterium RIFCSPLOWO2_01_FULL_45_25b]
MSLHLRIATLERTVFDEDVDIVMLPGEAGELGVLSGHIPLITPLILGEIVAKKNGEEFVMAVSGGMAEVNQGGVLVLADQAERAEEIDEHIAETARAKAEEIMKEKRSDEEGFAEAYAELQKSLLRLKVARRKRKEHISNI